MIVNANDAEVERHYKFGRTLGQGTFATVKMATCLSDNTKWAVKIIKRSALTSEDEESLKMEIQILQLTNHPNIVSVKEVFYCKNYVYLVMDLMTGGELFDRIVTKDHYSEQEAKQALVQIVHAVKYCHEKNIVHRDLKPENILYQSPDENSPLKLADFGLATLLRSNQLMNVACGTPGYVAPEILKGVAYGKEVDMWSIGVILYILLCGFPPFYDDNNKKLFAQIVNANYSFPDPYWTNISTTAKDLVRKLLVVDARQRLTAVQVLAHPWMFEDNSASSLDHFRGNLKSYNARRRFRSAIRAVQITQLLRNKAKAGAAPPQSLLEVVEQQDSHMRSKSIDNSEIRDQIAAAVANSQAKPCKAMDIIHEASADQLGSSNNLDISSIGKEQPTATSSVVSSSQPSPAVIGVRSPPSSTATTTSSTDTTQSQPSPAPAPAATPASAAVPSSTASNASNSVRSVAGGGMHGTASGGGTPRKPVDGGGTPSNSGRHSKSLVKSH